MQSAVLMTVCGVVYIIGIPIACVILLRCNRRLIKDEALSESKEGQSFRDTYGQLFNSYDKSHWYFESVEMLKKMTLAGGLVLVAPGSSVQIMLGILVALSFLVVVLQFKPYADSTDNKLQAFATLQIMLTLLAGLALKTDTVGEYQQTFMGMLLLIINLSVVALGLLSVLIMLPTLAGCRCCQRKQSSTTKAATAATEGTVKVFPQNESARIDESILTSVANFSPTTGTQPPPPPTGRR